MGLLGKLRRRSPTKQPTDDILLLHAMMLMSNVDGYLAGSEIATLEGFINTLPEFKDANFDAQMAAAKKLRARCPTTQDAVAALGEISSEAVKQKAFVLVADIAMSSGQIDTVEEELLAAIQAALGIDDALATKIVEVLALKYAT